MSKSWSDWKRPKTISVELQVNSLGKQAYHSPKHPLLLRFGVKLVEEQEIRGCKIALTDL
jgi:hypothetical protein